MKNDLIFYFNLQMSKQGNNNNKMGAFIVKLNYIQYVKYHLECSIFVSINHVQDLFDYFKNIKLILKVN